MEFVGKILVLIALAGIAAIEVYHKEENTGLMNLILVLIAAVVGWLLPKNDHVLSMIAAVASFAALYLSAHAAGRAVRRHDEEEERLALVPAPAPEQKHPLKTENPAEPIWLCRIFFACAPKAEEAFPPDCLY